MKQIAIEARPRLAQKKNAVGRLRRQKVVPAVLYGGGEAAQNLEVDQKQLLQVLHGQSEINALIKLSVMDDQQPRQETVMIKEIQRHPVSDLVLHVDFVKIDLNQELEIRIPVIVTGAAPGVKEGGLLELVHREVEVRCLPTLIPENITLDVSQLNIGDAICVSDLPLQAGVKILVDSHEPIVHVVAPKLEEEKPAEAAEVVVAPETQEPEVIGEKEREERRAAKGEEG